MLNIKTLTLGVVVTSAAIGGLYTAVKHLTKPSLPKELAAIMHNAWAECVAADEAEAAALVQTPLAKAVQSGLIDVPQSFEERVATATQITPEPKLSLVSTTAPNEAFKAYYNSLVDKGQQTDFNPSWGRAGRGFKGLLKAKPVPGTYCSYNDEDQCGLIFKVDGRGVIAVIYQYEDKVLYSAEPDVELIFNNVELTVEDLKAFQNNQYVS